MSEIIAVTMPRWGLTMEEGLLTEWFAEAGSEVQKGVDIVEVESTKLAGTVESPATGTLRRQIVEVGQTVPCGTLLGIIADSSVSEEDLDAFAEGFVIVEEDTEEEQAAGPQTIDVGGAAISFLRKGDGEPVLLVHGFGGDATGWAFVQEGLAGSFDTIALDLPGHGASAKAIADGSLEGQARMLAAFIEALGVAPVHLIAHSMGGGVALALAAVRPELVRSMLLLAPMGLAPQINRQYLDDFITAERHRDLGKVLQTLFSDPSLVSRAMVDEVQRFKRVDGVREALDTIRDAIVSGDAQAVDLGKALQGFAGPYAILWGEDDKVVPPAGVSAGGVTLLPGVGHMPQAEAASKVVETALSILKP